MNRPNGQLFSWLGGSFATDDVLKSNPPHRKLGNRWIYYKPISCYSQEENTTLKIVKSGREIRKGCDKNLVLVDWLVMWLFVLFFYYYQGFWRIKSNQEKDKSWVLNNYFYHRFYHFESTGKINLLNLMCSWKPL